MRTLINSLVVIALIAVIYSVASNELRNSNFSTADLPPVPVVIVEVEEPESEGNWFTDLFRGDAEEEPAPDPVVEEEDKGNWFVNLFRGDADEETEPAPEPEPVVEEDDSKGNWFSDFFKKDEEAVPAA